MELEKHAFLSVNSTSAFQHLALATFHFQYENNPVYRSYCDLLNRAPAEVNSVEEIPYLPIRFFKQRAIKSFQGKSTITFSSSGTSSTTQAQHHVLHPEIYQACFERIFEDFYGKASEWTILALLPAYLEREGSSLVYMMDLLIKKSDSQWSGFYLNQFEQLAQTLTRLEEQKQPTLLLGVSFALLDFAEKHPQNLQHTLVMETGGMKGRREEITREALHQQLKKGFGVDHIHSEYGMTELLSQAYSKGNGLFSGPPWMKVTPHEINDPFSPSGIQKIGRLNIMDLANSESCAFIATDDLGRVHPEGEFEVLGRMDNSDIRGCNLMVY